MHMKLRTVTLYALPESRAERRGSSSPSGARSKIIPAGSGTAVTVLGEAGYVPLGMGGPCNWTVLSLMP